MNCVSSQKHSCCFYLKSGLIICWRAFRIGSVPRVASIFLTPFVLNILFLFNLLSLIHNTGIDSIILIVIFFSTVIFIIFIDMIISPMNNI